MIWEGQVTLWVKGRPIVLFAVSDQASFDLVSNVLGEPVASWSSS